MRLSVSMEYREVRLYIGVAISYVLSFKHPKYQLPLVMLAKEYRYKGDVEFAEIIF